jgi:hypothetical protein
VQLLSTVTDALNERLNDIAATQKLVALHRSFTNVPSSFSFVVPGRRLLRQGQLRFLSLTTGLILIVVLA